MTFLKFTKFLERIENTSSRMEMTQILSELLSVLDETEVEKAIYLSLGSLGPPFDKVEFNISEKLMLAVLASAYGVSEDVIENEYKELGDFGELVAKRDVSRKGSSLSIEQVFDSLLRIAKLSGNGSQRAKVVGLAEVVSKLPARANRFLVRIPLKKLRLGFSDMTILDAISWALKGDKSLRQELERAYNVSADIGRLTRVALHQGLESISTIKITPGIPIRPAAAARMPDAQSIIEKLGKSAVEPKIDGFRLQCHFSKKGLLLRFSGDAENKMFDNTDSVRIYSRNLEDMTHMFPDIIAEIENLGVDSVIFEGEAVAVDMATGAFLPFQETIQRRRKHNVAKKAKEIPLKLFAFDVLYLNGEELIDLPYRKRREKLEGIVSPGARLSVTSEKIISSGKELQRYFYQQIEKGLEGVMVKRLDAPYAAGRRNFNWVKLKREERGTLNDTVDCVVMGYKLGKGKRTKFGIGAFLVGIYDAGLDIFKTVSNVGTGLTDEQWVELGKRLSAIKAKRVPARYDVPKNLEQDVWVEPSLVAEILADEITVSPMHTAKYALRFPRLVKLRDDKSPEEATTLAELEEMFEQQKKR